MKSRLRRLAGRALLATAALLLVAELGLRVTGTHYRFPTDCTWNPRVGCLLDPNVSDEYLVPEGGFHFTTNSEGRRDKARGQKRPGTQRILILGDSVAFGVPVEDAETFASQLEKRLADNVEVLNAGSPFLRSTEQQLSYFLDYGAALKPDVVLVEFTARNDFTDNSHRYFWRKGPSGIERVEHTEPATLHHKLVLFTSHLWPFQFLDHHSWLWDLFEAGYWHIMHLPPEDAQHEDRTAATEEVLARLKTEVEKSGATLVVLLHPSPELIATIRRRDPLPPNLDEDTLREIVARLHIPLIDPMDIIASASNESRLDDSDGHLNVRGNAAIAAYIAAHLPPSIPRQP